MSEHTRRISRRTFFGGAAAFGAVSLLSPAIAFADPTSAEKQAEADAVRIQVTAMQEELQKASDDYNKALEEHDAAVAAMEDAQKRIDETNAKIGDVQDKLGTRARAMYRSGGISFLDILFGAHSFEEFATNWAVLNSMNENDAKMVQQSKDLRTQIEAEKEEYSKQEKIAAEKTEEARVIKEKAESTVTEMQAVLDGLDAEARALLEKEQQAAAEAAAAAARAAFEEEQRQQQNNPPGGGGGGGGFEVPSGGGSNIPTNGSVVDYAVSRLGCPYVWAGKGPDVFDCSGLTRWCYLQVGKEIGGWTGAQYSNARAILPVSEAAPGDVLYNSGHVGICTTYGGGEYIHAPQTGDVVRYSTWPQFYCALRF